MVWNTIQFIILIQSFLSFYFIHFILLFCLSSFQVSQRVSASRPAPALPNREPIIHSPGGATAGDSDDDGASSEDYEIPDQPAPADQPAPVETRHKPTTAPKPPKKKPLGK